MHAYLGSIWNCRFFWLSLVKTDLRSRYRGSVLGIGWSLLHPIAMTTILCVVFGVVFGINVREYAPYLFVGMTFWGYFTSVLVQGCGCFFQGESYIRQFPAPMAIYPLRTALGSGFHFLIGLLLAVLLSLGTGPKDAHISRLFQLLALPSLVPTFVLLFLLGWSVAILCGLLNVRFRDTRHLAEIGLQGLFYMLPIMIPPEQLARRGRLSLVFRCNPLTPFFDLLREPICYGHAPSLMTYTFAATVVLVLCTTAIFALQREERQLIFHL
ncbi:MAG TPA: ABC transporter permease [Gemmataceae bacterium]|nr:ABC transporter permease [Gemmataceae bacterium]